MITLEVMSMVIRLSDRAAARARAIAVARGVSEDQVLEDLLDATRVDTIEPGDGEDALAAFLGAADSGDPAWAGTDTRLLRQRAD